MKNYSKYRDGYFNFLLIIETCFLFFTMTSYYQKYDCTYVHIILPKNLTIFLISGQNLVSKPTSKSETSTRSRNRKIENGFIFKTSSPRFISSCTATILPSSPSDGGPSRRAPHRAPGASAPSSGPSRGPPGTPKSNTELQSKFWGSTHSLMAENPRENNFRVTNGFCK